MGKKVVITGMGSVISQLGGVEGLSRVLKENECQLSEVEGVGPQGESVVGGHVLQDYLEIEGKSYPRYPKFVRIGMASAVEAVRQSGLSESYLQEKRVAVLGATSTGGVKEVEYYSMLVREGRLKEFPIQVTAMCNNHSIATGVASHFGLQEQTFTVNDSCNAGMDAVYLGKLLLMSGEADVVIVTGADSPHTQGMVYSFAKTRSIYYGKSVENVGIPFSKNSRGFAMSEGAATIVLEREEDVVARGGRALASVENIHVSFDGCSILTSDRTGSVLDRSIAKVLSDGDVPDYVNSQALGLRENDGIEANNHVNRFGSTVPLTTIKGHLGQTFGAAPILQIISSVLSIEEGYIPPSLRSDLEGYDGVPVVTETLHRPVGTVLVTSHGFGGNNGAALIKRIVR